MPSDKHNTITAKAMGLIFHYLTLLQPKRCLLAYRSMYNAFFMDLPAGPPTGGGGGGGGGGELGHFAPGPSLRGAPGGPMKGPTLTLCHGPLNFSGRPCLPVSSFVSHSSLLLTKSIDLVVACDGFPS